MAANANGAAAGKSDSKQGAPGAGVSVEDFKKLVDSVASLAKGVSDQGVNFGASLREMQQFNSTLADTLKQLASGTVQKEPVEKEETLDQEKIDRMSNLQLTQFLEQRNAKMMRDLIKTEIVPHMKALRDGLGSVDAATAVQAMRSKYKDFDVWTPEVEKIVKDSKGVIDLDDAYQLARVKNPAKAKEQDDKLAKTQADDAAKSFGGMKPTGSPQRVEKQDMSEADAAETAWNEVMGSLPEDAKKDLILTP